jgi:hypothetical protein
VQLLKHLFVGGRNGDVVILWIQVLAELNEKGILGRLIYFWGH